MKLIRCTHGQPSSFLDQRAEVAPCLEDWQSISARLDYNAFFQSLQGVAQICSINNHTQLKKLRCTTHWVSAYLKLLEIVYYCTLIVNISKKSLRIPVSAQPRWRHCHPCTYFHHRLSVGLDGPFNSLRRMVTLRGAWMARHPRPAPHDQDGALHLVANQQGPSSRTTWTVCIVWSLITTGQRKFTVLSVAGARSITPSPCDNSRPVCRWSSPGPLRRTDIIEQSQLDQCWCPAPPTFYNIPEKVLKKDCPKLRQSFLTAFKGNAILKVSLGYCR